MEYLQYVLQDLDSCIANEVSNDATDWPFEPTELEGTVKPVASTYDEDYGLVFILAINPINGTTQYVSITYGDGGVIVGRSRPSDDLETLKFETNETWSQL